ncbi:CarD family transcriptional regulator [Methyloceanibacter sp. wino2]
MVSETAPTGRRQRPRRWPKSTQTSSSALVPTRPTTFKQRGEHMAEKKRPQQRNGFRTNEYIVYPAHGVGRITSIEEQEIAGAKLELFVISFDKDKMTLRVPTTKLESVGMRKLSEDKIVKKALTTLKGKARVKRTMWSRRAQEYEAKINSGDLISIAEVVRDLYRSEAQPEQSYSERQLYEAALDRMARELAAVEKLDEESAVAKIDDILAKSARTIKAAAEAAEAGKAAA